MYQLRIKAQVEVIEMVSGKYIFRRVVRIKQANQKHVDVLRGCETQTGKRGKRMQPGKRGKSRHDRQETSFPGSLFFPSGRYEAVNRSFFFYLRKQQMNDPTMSLAFTLTFDPFCLKSCSLERERNGKETLRGSLQQTFLPIRRPRGHEHISFVFLSAFRDIFS